MYLKMSVGEYQIRELEHCLLALPHVTAKILSEFITSLSFCKYLKTSKYPSLCTL